MPVAFSGARKRVGDLVEEDLVHLVLACGGAEVARERNALLAVDALAKPRFGVVPPKMPTAQAVLSKELTRSVFHPEILRHPRRVVTPRPGAWDLSPE